MDLPLVPGGLTAAESADVGDDGSGGQGYVYTVPTRRELVTWEVLAGVGAIAITGLGVAVVRMVPTIGMPAPASVWGWVLLVAMYPVLRGIDLVFERAAVRWSGRSRGVVQILVTVALATVVTSRFLADPIGAFMAAVIALLAFLTLVRFTPQTML